MLKNGMLRNGCLGLRNCCLGLAMAMALGSASRAELVHQYTFNDGNVDDAIGGQNGTVVNPMGVPAFYGGHLDLRANNTETNGNIPSGQGTAEDQTIFTTGLYADLPNFMISDVAIDSFGIMTFEAWVTIETNRTWSRIFDFGISNEGEDTAVSGDMSEYIFLTATNGGGNVEFTTRSLPPNNINGFAVGPPDPTPGGQHHYVAVLDQSDLTEDVNGTLSLYFDGQLVDTGPVAIGLNTLGMDDRNNWLGRSQWGADPLLDGMYNEFRIYDHALSAQEVLDSFNAGPEAVNPRFVVNRDDGTITLVSSGIDGDLAGYSLTSAFGSLDADAWTPITDRLDSGGDGTFDDAAWSTDAQSVDELAEAATAGTGGQLTSATSISLGDVWVPSPVEDLVARVQLADGSIVGGEVVYEGNGGESFIRSDLNFDGMVDAGDWTVFVGGLFGEFDDLGGALAYGMGDLDGDLDNDVQDFRLFKTDFDAVNGAGAFASLTGVPEPSTFAIAVLAVAAASVLAVRRRGGWLARRSLGLLLPGLVATLVLCGLGSVSVGDMVHRWSFNEVSGTDVADEIGGADGMVLGDGATFLGGRVILPGGASGTAPYVDLPNGIVSSLTDATFEGWAVVDGAQNWGRLFDFGSTTGGELLGPGGGGEGLDYFMLSVSRGTNNNVQRLEFRNNDQAFLGADAGMVTPTTQLMDTGIATTVGEEFHYAVTFDSAADVMRQYRNGQFIAEAPVTFELGNLNDVNNWLGRSNWTGDANYEGSFSEFRIYDEALDDQAILDSFEAGPDAGGEGPPVLELEVNASTGQVTIRNPLIVPVDFDFYSISSAGGALNAGGWNSLSEQEIDAIGAGIGESWDQGGLADDFEVGEAFLLGGTVLDPDGSLSLGQAFNPSVFGGQAGDLTFLYSNDAGITLPGRVTYTDIGEPPTGIPGDYSGNGLVEQADLDLVLGNWGQNADNLPATWVNDPAMGFVDQNELDKVLSNWGASAGLAGAAAVPEPGTAGIAALVFAAAAIAALRRHQRPC